MHTFQSPLIVYKEYPEIQSVQITENEPTLLYLHSEHPGITSLQSKHAVLSEY